MAEITKIEWADSTFNPWIGCTKVSPACDNCYAQNLMDRRMGKVKWGAGQPRGRTGVKNWNLPLRWNREPFAGCNECGWRGVPVKRGANHHCGHCDAVNLSPARSRVFCASLADVFDNEVDPAWRADLFKLIDATPNLDWLLLTKRIGNAEGMYQAAMGPSWADDVAWPSNVWLGATVVNQEEADRDIPKLLAVPAAKRFLSIEPMLGPINIEPYLLSTYDKAAHDDQMAPGLPTTDRLDWIIVGGESGPGARPMHPDWVRSVRDQCDAAGVPFMFKQWGEWGPDWEGAETCGSCGGSKFDFINSYGECGRCGVDSWVAAEKPLDSPRRVGKKTAGRLLDGREWNEAPA